MVIGLLDAISRFLSGFPSLVLAFLGVGGLLWWWRWLLLRQKRLDAALEVLAGLGLVQEAFHDARRQNMSVFSRDASRFERISACQSESERVLGKLQAAQDGLHVAQAKAVALWGEPAKEPFQKVNMLVDALISESKRHWPEAVRCARIFDQREQMGQPVPAFPQPSRVIYGHRGDDVGRVFEIAIREAWDFYESLRSGKKRGKQNAPPMPTGR